MSSGLLFSSTLVFAGVLLELTGGPDILLEPLPLGSLALGDLLQQLQAPGLPSLGRKDTLLLETLLLLALKRLQSLGQER